MDVVYQSVSKNEEDKKRLEDRNLLESDEYLSATGKINIPIGITESGEIIVRDLNDIPHILVCGFTGSGKTSFVNTIIAVICNNGPINDIKLIIYDSKGVEYTAFKNVPQLLMPIITDCDRAKGAIAYLDMESKQRFSLFASKGCRDLATYNQRVPDDEVLPVIILVLDDYSTLNLDKNSLYEFQNVLKNGRIAGIHMIVVSSISASKVLQKDLISNIPCRISFKLTSKTESKHVLETYGAEMLTVPGEIIYKNQNESYKCMCAYSSFENIENTVGKKHIISQNISALGAAASKVFSDLPKHVDNNSISKANKRQNEMLIEAGKIVITSGKANIGFLQRSFRLGFNDAAHLMDDLEKYGVVGSENGFKPRVILMTLSEWEKTCENEFGDVKSFPPSIKSPSVQAGFSKEDQNGPEIKLRDFDEFMVNDVSISINNHKIKYSKPIMTRLGRGEINPEFSGSSVTRIIYKKPSLFSKGFFTFEFSPDVKIVNPNDYLLHADISNISELIKVEFGSDKDRIIQLFLQQISEDIGIPVSRV